MSAVPEWVFSRVDEAAEIAALVNDAYRATGQIKGWTSEGHLLGGQRIDADMLADILVRDGSRVLLARVEGQLGACIHLERVSSTVAAFGLFAVRPAIQGQGIGRSLVTYAECWAKAHWGVQQAEITVIDLRRDLVAWYLRMGYRFTGERKAFPYGDARFGIPKRSDLALAVMRKTLGSSGC
jgi:GNAT superfamily N-acetyltransferase